MLYFDTFCQSVNIDSNNVKAQIIIPRLDPLQVAHGCIFQIAQFVLADHIDCRAIAARRPGLDLDKNQDLPIVNDQV